MSQSQLLRQSEEVSYQQEAEQNGEEIVAGKDVSFSGIASFDVNVGGGTAATGLFSASGCAWRL